MLAEAVVVAVCCAGCTTEAAACCTGAEACCTFAAVLVCTGVVVATDAVLAVVVATCCAGCATGAVACCALLTFAAGT